jgi:hypothetical protein
MSKLDQHSAYAQLAYLLLPESVLFGYDVVNIELTDLPESDPLMTGWIKIYLEEKDSRNEEQKVSLKPNGFTEGRWFDDFPLRDRKVSLNVRRRRYTDADGHNVLLNNDNLVAEGTSYSAEFGAFLKEVYGHLPGYGPHRGALIRD